MGKKKSELIRDTPVKILFGNLNTNLNMEEAVVRQKLKEINSDYNDYRGLLKTSEAYQSKAKLVQYKIAELIKCDEIAVLR